MRIVFYYVKKGKLETWLKSNCRLVFVSLNLRLFIRSKHFDPMYQYHYATGKNFLFFERKTNIKNQ